jgi:hypothetical protein
MELATRKVTCAGITPHPDTPEAERNQHIRRTLHFLFDETRAQRLIEVFFLHHARDETGYTNAIFRPKLSEEVRLVINLEWSPLITGRVQNEDGVIHVMAERIQAMPVVDIPVQDTTIITNRLKIHSRFPPEHL